MRDEELRLECLKIAFQSFLPRSRFGEDLYEYNLHVPENSTVLANKYYDYLKTGIPVKIECEK